MKQFELSDRTNDWKRTGIFFYYFSFSDKHSFYLTKDMFKSMEVYWKNEIKHENPYCYLLFKGYLL